VPGIFLRIIAQSLQVHSPGVASADKAALHIGGVAFIHRLWSSLNEHVHFHPCVVDGVFEKMPASIELPGTGHWWPSGYAAYLSQTFPPPRSAMRIGRRELSDSFMEPRQWKYLCHPEADAREHPLLVETRDTSPYW